eukprot:1172111-Prorocentrum_minimum.AAC.1
MNTSRSRTFGTGVYVRMATANEKVDLTSGPANCHHRRNTARKGFAPTGFAISSRQQSAKMLYRLALLALVVPFASGIRFKDSNGILKSEFQIRLKERPKPDFSESSAYECHFDPAKHLDCGFSGIDQAGCEGKGCCWAEGSGPWCFYKKGVTPPPAPTPGPCAPIFKTYDTSRYLLRPNHRRAVAPYRNR